MILFRSESSSRHIGASSTSRDSLPTRPDLIPLLDVIFSVLACFAFMLAMSELRPSSLPVSLPTVNADGAGAASEQAPIEISFDAAELVMLDDELVTIENLEVALASALLADPTRPVRLRGDRAAPHGLTATILAAVSAAGAEHVEIAIQSRDPEAP
jgi:biopolymer transport protein ExbD